MERALTLVATGTLTVAMAHGTKGKVVALPRTLNPSTGKESMRQTGFSDASWGKVTRGYAVSISSLSKAKYDAIVEAAQPFTKPARSHNRGDPTEVIDVDADNERACLVDNSDSDSCNIFNFLFTDLTNLIFQDIYYCLPSSWTLLLCSIHHLSSWSLQLELLLLLLSFCFLAIPTHHCQIQLWLLLSQASGSCSIHLLSHFELRHLVVIQLEHYTRA